MAAARIEALALGVITRRGRARWTGLAVQLAIMAVVLWSLEAIVVGDTDWSRISAASVARALARFAEFDWALLPDLLRPALETAVMATLATLLGLVLAIPVAWLGARNVSPLGHASYAVARMLMTLSRSVHEIVWALLFVAAVGLGALAGIMAMAVRSLTEKGRR